MQFPPVKTNKLTILLFVVALSGGAVSSCPAQGQIASLDQKDAPAPAENDGFVQGGAGYFATGLHFPGLQLPGRGTARFFSVGGSGYGVVGGRLGLFVVNEQKWAVFQQIRLRAVA